MYFTGIDLSFTGTGLIILDNQKNVTFQEVITSNSKDETTERIQKITNRILNKLDEHNNLNGIYIEGISYGSTGKAFSQLSGLYYHTLIELENKFPSTTIKSIPPGTLKKFITGKGNAKKDLILLNVYKKFGIEFNNSDLADAFSLAMMAYEANT